MISTALRDDTEMLHLQGQIDTFINNYFGNSTPKRTVVLFPGGLASALIRAKTRSPPGAPPPTDFWHFWIIVDLLFGVVKKLALQGDDDFDDHVIIPNAEVEIMGVSPYQHFRYWCRNHNINLFVFGYDWRRKPEYTIKFFFDRFLPALGQQVRDRLGSEYDALQDLTLIGHSLGGMLVKLIMNDPTLAPRIARGITVGSNFYGYTGHTLRFFEGEKEFFLSKKKDVAKIVASLEGGYCLQFLDAETYEKYGAALASVHDYPLTSYPSHDPGGQVADPYNPVDTDAGVRYPPWIDRDQLRNELDSAKKTVQQIATDLPPDVAKKFFNIRGVQSKNSTLNAQTWSVVPKDFDPDAANALVALRYDPPGPGDGTLPAWSSRHVGLEATFPDNVTTLLGDVEHMFLMELPQTQDRILEILEGRKPKSRTIPVHHGAFASRIAIAPFAQVSAFVHQLQQFPTADEAQQYLDNLQRTNPTRAEMLARGILSLLVSGAARPEFAP